MSLEDSLDPRVREYLRIAAIVLAEGDPHQILATHRLRPGGSCTLCGRAWPCLFAQVAIITQRIIDGVRQTLLPPPPAPAATGEADIFNYDPADSVPPVLGE
jgi:hypothetical protein